MYANWVVQFVDMARVGAQRPWEKTHSSSRYDTSGMKGSIYFRMLRKIIWFMLLTWFFKEINHCFLISSNSFLKVPFTDLSSFIFSFHFYISPGKLISVTSKLLFITTVIIMMSDVQRDIQFYSWIVQGTNWLCYPR